MPAHMTWRSPLKAIPTAAVGNSFCSSPASAAKCMQRMAPMRVAAIDDLQTSDFDNIDCSKPFESIVNYALEFCKASQTYQVHPWMFLLGILKHENCRAAKTLKSMGIDDLYGAWHEVLWALHVCDGLQPRAFQPEIGFADSAHSVFIASANLAESCGRQKVQSEDLLLALAAANILEGLFPDLNLSLARVRKAVEQQTGCHYVMPGEDTETAPTSESVDFL